uniref:WAT1-related protein n=1 Tax=Kalanchoe fedtschenkoi TaxID=63787 RepID=A0A7N0TTH1_KALFE
MGWWKECLPFAAMVLVQLGYAGMNIFSKAAMDSGMTPYVLVTYRQIFATAAIAPFAFFLERKIRPKMTRRVLYQSIFCSFFGATLNVFLYFVGLQYTTPTIACAADNTFPAITYIVGIFVGMEKLKIVERAGQAKVFGTVVCVGGAMVLSFYHGSLLRVPQSGIHWTFVEGTAEEGSGHHSTFLGPLLVIRSCVSWAFWLMVQTKLSQNYPVPFTNTTLMCFWSIFPSAIVSVIVNHRPSDWSLKSPIRLVSVLYAVCRQNQS